MLHLRDASPPVANDPTTDCIPTRATMDTSASPLPAAGAALIAVVIAVAWQRFGRTSSDTTPTPPDVPAGPEASEVLAGISDLLVHQYQWKERHGTIFRLQM